LFSKSHRNEKVRAGLEILAPYGPALGPTESGAALKFWGRIMWALQWFEM